MAGSYDMKVKHCLAIAALALVSCASSTPGPIRRPSTAAPASNVLTPVVTTADDPRTTAANRYAREMGYKLVTRHGVQFYCRKTAPLGSRLEETQCLTADGMAQAAQINDENMNAWQESSHLCLGSGCAVH
jgi:hypothetical protein